MKQLLLVLCAVASLQAAVVTYNFEGQPLATGITSLNDTQGGITLTVTRQSNGVFDVSDINSFLGPSKASWGFRTLSPFTDTSAKAYIFSLSAAVSSFSVELGDFGQDSDTWSLTAFSGPGGTGTNLGNVNGSWGTQDLSITAAQVASISAAGIVSVVAIGGSTSFPMSLYWDNVSVNTAAAGIPEPGTMVLLGGGLALCLLGRKFRRA